MKKLLMAAILLASVSAAQANDDMLHACQGDSMVTISEYKSDALAMKIGGVGATAVLISTGSVVPASIAYGVFFLAEIIFEAFEVKETFDFIKCEKYIK